MEYTPLRKVTADTQQWCVKARVVRFSELFSTDDSTKVVRLDFVMVDEEGDCMEAQIPHGCIDKYRPMLAEDNVYYLRYFEVDKARSNYRPVDHSYLARLTRFTEVYHVPAVPPSFPRYGCKVVPFSVLKERAGKRFLMSDAIGLLTKCSHASSQSTRAGMRSIRTVHITDGSDTVVVTLWGPHAEQFNAEAYMAMGAQSPVALLFAGVTSSIFEGRLRLQASTSCRWYENPDLPEATMLKQRFGFTVGRPEWLGPAVPPAPVGAVTITDLAAIDNPHKVWLYCLTFLATDPAAPEEAEEHVVELVCFGPTGEELTGVPAEVLVTVAAGARGGIPEHILRLYGRQYELRLSVSRGSLRRKNMAFKVDAILNALPPPAALQYIEAAGTPPGTAEATAQQNDQPEASTGTPSTDAPLATPKASPESPPATPVSSVLQTEDRTSAGLAKGKRARDMADDEASLQDEINSDDESGKKRRYARKPNRKLSLDLSPEADASPTQH
ncbi:hypothetical protein ACP70R_003087 [Stipagrostis hirtigluma subsp. patula]